MFNLFLYMIILMALNSHKKIAVSRQFINPKQDRKSLKAIKFSKYSSILELIFFFQIKINNNLQTFLNYSQQKNYT